MAEKIKIPEFIKERIKTAIEPLNKLEDRFREITKKMTEGKTVSQTELKKSLNEAVNWVKGTRTNVEKAFNEGVSWTFSALNLPNREDIGAIEAKVEKLAKDLKSLELKITGKSKPQVKKVSRKKKAVKKPSVKR